MVRLSTTPYITQTIFPLISCDFVGFLRAWRVSSVYNVVCDRQYQVAAYLINLKSEIKKRVVIIINIMRSETLQNVINILFRDYYFLVFHICTCTYILTLSPLNKLSSAKFLVCFNFLNSSILLKVGEKVIWVSNSLDPDETPSYSVSHPDPICLHMVL